MAMAKNIVAMLCSGSLCWVVFKVTRRILPVVPVPRQVSNPQSLRVQEREKGRHALASRQNAHYNTCG
ncbi:uncharacterized protein An15g06070 [Aspergillus niger]|uniref:Contig An15c0200, genomic contig n=2 Tax=Aspergillus niger TaxID=5061 RepID=A2R5Z3_ASPNC|nr:uncharacterized protein An15g06070 [Aspergillus niger]CAK42560.1 unnamed protein product [Aspergillus niger]